MDKITEKYEIVNFWKNVLDFLNLTKLIVEQKDWLDLDLFSN